MKELTPLGLHIYAHVANREKGSYGACTESVARMAARFHVSNRSIIREINKMVKDGFLTKAVIPGKGQKLNLCQSDLCQNVTCDKLSPPPMTECQYTCDNLSPNLCQSDIQKEKEKNNENKILKEKGDKSPRGKKAPPFSSLPDGEVKAALMDYVEVRKGSKSPIKTERQERLLLNKLEELSGGDTAKKVKIIEAATVAGWKSFYPLKEETKIQKQQQQDSNGHSESFKQLLDDIEYAKNRPKPWEKRRLQQEKSESAKKLDADLEYYETHQVYPWEVQKNDNDKKEL